MKKQFDQVYQFKITLKDIKPPVWRRIQVPASYSFWDLHVAIQDAMGWTDSHLHEFRIANPKTRRKVNIGIPDEDSGSKVSPGWKKNIAAFFTPENSKAEYTYDFGDNWRHEVDLEAILPWQKGVIRFASMVCEPVRLRTAAALMATKDFLLLCGISTMMSMIQCLTGWAESSTLSDLTVQRCPSTIPQNGWRIWKKAFKGALFLTCNSPWSCHGVSL